MPLYLVIGYTNRKLDAGSAKVLYSGSDAAQSKTILAAANVDYPCRERYIRPYPNGGRKIDAAPAEAQPEPTPAPDPADSSADTSAVVSAEAEASAQAEDAPKAKKK